jgi:hypothetical protein
MGGWPDKKRKNGAVGQNVPHILLLLFFFAKKKKEMALQPYQAPPPVPGEGDGALVVTAGGERLTAEEYEKRVKEVRVRVQFAPAPAPSPTTPLPASLSHARTQKQQHPQPSRPTPWARS